eukprot:jgi/Chlat1/4503/Chrsp29S04577
MDFLEYLGSLPALKLDRLYASHWTCQALLRSLPPLAKQYVLRLLFVDASLPARTLQDWAQPTAAAKHRAALDRLRQLRVLLEEKGGDKDSTGPPEVQLPPSVAKRLPTVEELDAYALQQWEAVLLHLVSSGAPAVGQLGSTKLPAAMRSHVSQTFMRAGLMDKERGSITDSGFRFLLLDIFAQLWQLIHEYVTTAEGRGMDAAQQRVVEEVASLGLVYTLKANDGQRWYLPTRLASNLSAGLSSSSSSSSGGGAWQAAEGFIVVETNYRVYAYTASAVQMAVLRLFCKIDYRLPNVVVGSVTRDSVRSALGCGISAAQIIEYLQKHAHAQVADRTPAVPETVADQIRLWEYDMQRVRQYPAQMYEDFPSPEVFDAVVAHARDALGVLLFHDAAKRRLVVHATAHPQMRAFIAKFTKR